MFNVDHLEIRISQGDTGALFVTFKGNDIPADDVECIVSLKKNPQNCRSIWTKSLDIQDAKSVISLSSDDTMLPPGKYYWDLRLKYPDGNIFTPIRPTPFYIVEVVGDVA